MTAVLTPLSALYHIAIKARHKLYDHGFMRKHELPVPVISVGNITVGGTGKTPLVIWIAGKLAQSGAHVCILTRGYGRRDAKARVLVSNGTEILSDPERAGDEPFLLAEKLSGQAAVVSDQDRVAAGLWAHQNLASNVFLLDDGFQHLRIARDLNIVTIDATNPWGNGKVLPAGILREPLSRLSQADCLVITRADEANQLDDLRRELSRLAGEEKPLFLSRMKLSGTRQVNASGANQPSGEFEKSSPLAAFCGIGNPGSFFSLLRGSGFQLSHTEVLRDHFVYDQATLDRLVEAAKESCAEAVITTAKDEVKLRKLKCELTCLAADIEIEIEGEEALTNLITQACKKSREKNNSNLE